MSDYRTLVKDNLKRIKAQGACAFCDHPFAYHRVADAQMERVAAGDSIESVAIDYGETVPTMVAKWLALAELLAEPRRVSQ